MFIGHTCVNFAQGHSSTEVIVESTNLRITPKSWPLLNQCMEKENVRIFTHELANSLISFKYFFSFITAAAHALNAMKQS